MKFVRWSTCLVLVAALCPAASALPSKVKWKAHLEPAGARAGEGAQVVVQAEMEAGWHIYSIKPPVGEGPKPTKIDLLPGKALTAAGAAVEPAAHRIHDPGFNKDLEEFPGAVAFGVPVKLKSGISGAQTATVSVKYQTCKEGSCLPPRTDEVPVAFSVAPGPARADHQKPITAAPKQPAGYTPPGASGASGSAPGGAGVTAGTVTTPAGDSTAREIEAARESGLLPFLWLSVLYGFLALLTPCVFPMVPITVSYFTKHQEKAPGGGVKGAVAYCAGIVFTFTGLGIATSLLLGPQALKNAANGPVTNLALAILFGVMALNLLGAFEITLPSWLIEKSQSSSQKSGLLGPVLMGLTFTLTSFTCTAAFVGTVLATATRGNLFWPTLGMLAFSAAFASPFFLLALFPQWLAKLPKSGGWLVNVKAFMGFMELAAALKFLSNADLVWQRGLITRPVFLAIWFAIFVLAGCHLLGWLRLPHDQGTSIGPLRRVFGAVSIVFGLVFLGAMNGLPLGQAEGFPPPDPYPGRSAGVETGGLRWIENYDAALAAAKAENKPLFIDFTGVTCTNCRVMERTVFQRPEVVSELKNFVTARLYTDKEDRESNRYQKMQEQRFGQTTLPLYVVLDPSENKKGERAYNTDVNAFVGFLREAKSAATQVARGS